MQVNVVSGGDAAVAALLYRPPDQNLLNYLNNKMQQAIDYASNMVTGYAENMRAMYDRFNSSQAIQAAKMFMYNLGMNTSEMVIQRFHSSEDFKPNLLMQRYIMSCPEVSKLDKQNMCSGFAESYVDPEPGVYGTERNDYRRVMDGVLQHEGEEGVFYWYSSAEDESELEPIDQFAVMDAWHICNQLILGGKDPTDLDS